MSEGARGEEFDETNRGWDVEEEDETLGSAEGEVGAKEDSGEDELSKVEALEDSGSGRARESMDREREGSR